MFIDQVQRGPFQSHLLFDMRRLNENNPPSLIRGQTNNKNKQTCYFVSYDNDNDYDTYISERINKDYFKIKSSVGKTNFGNKFTLKADRNLNRINRDSKFKFNNEESSSSSDSSYSYSSSEPDNIKRRKKYESNSNHRRNHKFRVRGKARWNE